MIEKLNKIRSYNKEELKLKNKVINTSLILVLGIMLGIFSKWLDGESGNIGIFEFFDLGNFFSRFSIWIFIAVLISVYSKSPFRSGLNVLLFFVGMTVSYHLYTIVICGFNPLNYMMIWYGITIASPILAFICFYAKGEGYISVAISTIVLAAMILCCFAIGFWYFDIVSILDLLVFLGTIIILYVKPKNTAISIILAVIVAYLFRIIY